MKSVKKLAINLLLKRKPEQEGNKQRKGCTVWQNENYENDYPRKQKPNSFQLRASKECRKYFPFD